MSLPAVEIRAESDFHEPLTRTGVGKSRIMAAAGFQAESRLFGALRVISPRASEKNEPNMADQDHGNKGKE